MNRFEPIITLSVDTGGTGSVRQEQSIDAATLVQTNNALAQAKEISTAEMGKVTQGFSVPGLM